MFIFGVFTVVLKKIIHSSNRNVEHWWTEVFEDFISPYVSVEASLVLKYVQPISSKGTFTIPLGDPHSLVNIPLFHDNITLHTASTYKHVFISIQTHKDTHMIVCSDVRHRCSHNTVIKTPVANY